MTSKFSLILGVVVLLLAGAVTSIWLNPNWIGRPVTIDSLEALRRYASQDGANVRLKPGTYTLDQASSQRFIEFSGKDSRFDLRGTTLRVDSALFSKFGNPGGPDEFYRVIDLSGDRTVLTGAKIETFGDQPGIQPKNKIVNVWGAGAELRDFDITTAGSSPWGYGSLFGIAGGVVRKMNGIRIGYPAKGAKIIGCRVHMRAMGHAIFVQGATDTLIEDCDVDGLLRPTDEILAETSGLAFDRGFKTGGQNYVEGIRVGPGGEIIPGEMISLSEDGIRLYDKSGEHRTGPTTIRNCTVRQMRRGICTGLGPEGDLITGCEAHDCVAAGFNIGSGDRVENSRADAKYSEALCIPYRMAQGARVDLEILDSRGGLGNDLLAVINGRNHKVRLHTPNPDFVPTSMQIVLGANRGYAFYQKSVSPAENIKLTNETPARVVSGQTPNTP